MKNKIYYPQITIFLYLKAGICLLVAILLLYIGYDLFTEPKFIAPMPVTVPSGLLWLFLAISFFFSCSCIGFHIYQARFQRLVISPEKIEYCCFGYRVSCAWKDIKSIERNEKYQFGIRLLLHDYLLDIWRPHWLFKVSSKEHVAYIPAIIFDVNWETGEIGQLIKLYAPHLFQDYDIQFLKRGNPKL